MNQRAPIVDESIWRGKSAPEDIAADTESALLQPLFTPWQRRETQFMVVVWLVFFTSFWVWWMQSTQNAGVVGFVYVTLCFAWLTLMPVYFFVVFLGSRVTAKNLSAPEGIRVAMVVTKAPSEPFSLVAKTLEAMLRQTYPHDTWLADEDPSPETLAWCKEKGVQVSSRKDHPDYHRPTWPRRVRCKEGNLAFFYDHYGYRSYDFVAQMDADHAPAPTYLSQVLKPFADPRIGYVSAPSMCDNNVARSWSARARLYAEATMHGPLQAGYTGGWAPLCIGSHYAVRTVALKAIGGLGPDLAEDHSTTLMMNAHGWRGVHALDAIAHGNGPNTFADLVTQEFQWSRSLVTILLRYSPTLVPHLPWKLKLQFMFCQLWYPLYSIIFALLFAMPIVALVSGKNFTDVTYADFFIHYAPMSLLLLIMVYRWRAHRWLRPIRVPIISWEGILFILAKWPWSLIGFIVAVRDRVTNSFVDFRVTPKGHNPVGPVPFRVLAPYIAISLASAFAALLLDDVGTASGFYLFAIVNSVLYAILILVIIIRHSQENRVNWRNSRIRLLAQACVMALLFGLPIAATASHGPEGLEGVSLGAGPFSLLRSLYSASGAGMGRGIRKLHFMPSWNTHREAPSNNEP